MIGHDPQALQHIIDELEHELRARDEFLAQVAHELRTPVQALLFHLDATLRGAGRTENPEEYLRGRVEKAFARVRELAQLLDRFFDVSRIQAGRLALIVGETDLVELTRDALARMADELAWAGCATSFVAPERVMGTWDATRIKAVLSNLLSNARKHAAGRPIDVHIEEDDDLVRLSVEDGGPGVPPEHRARIFERFERVFAPGAPTVPGVGLGLWISRQFVEAHGGTITVANRPGGGAVFTVTLPKRPPPRAT